jgi:bifunctional enzyme CysN/CysC
VFNKIRDDYLEFTKDLDTGDLCFIPMSALNGDNVVNASEKMPWYDGDTLMLMLENVKISADRNFEDFRFPVQYVNRPNLDFRGYAGTLASGVVRKGDLVTALPSGKTSTIKSIVTYDEELELAYTPMAITITLEDEIDISRGDMIVHSDNLPITRDEFSATIVWMNEKALLPGKQYDFKLNTKSISGQISGVSHKVDINTLETSPAPALELNEIGLCEVSLNEPVYFDDYKVSPGSGSFIIIDRLTNVTVGAGMIADAQNRGKHISTVSAHVTTEERAARFGQKPVTVMFIGLSGSGKSTLAHALERKLFDLGRVSTVLDGKQMRLGISKDLPHDAEGRAENLRRSAFIAKYLNDSGLICCAAYVSPNLDSREHMISVIGEENFLLIYLNPPLEVCKQRDPSGLYTAEENVPTGTVPGISFDYPEPENPDLILPTHELDVDECIDLVINVMKEKAVI